MKKKEIFLCSSWNFKVQHTVDTKLYCQLCDMIFDNKWIVKKVYQALTIFWN